VGLGLTLVRRLVELHGGTVVAHSNGPEQGSEFTVSLPITTAPTIVNSDSASDTGAPRAERLNTTLRVMIIDDNADAADSLATLLGAQGYSIAVEYNGEKGFQRAAAEAPDALLIDIGLPDIDGYSLAQRLRAHPRTARALLIAVTGYGQPRDREQALACGFSHHLVKPVDMPTLARALATLSPYLDTAV